jgi:hypothetical protein
MARGQSNALSICCLISVSAPTSPMVIIYGRRDRAENRKMPSFVGFMGFDGAEFIAALRNSHP